MNAAPSPSTPAGERGPRPGVDSASLSQSVSHGALEIDYGGVQEMPDGANSPGSFIAGLAGTFNVLKCIPRVQQGTKAGSVLKGIRPQS